MKEMKMTKKGIVRKIRRSLKNVDWREINVRDIDKNNFFGPWPNSGEKFGLWINSDIGYVHVGLE